jgi:hypothetical protein
MPCLLQVDQQPAEAPGLRVPPEFADPLRPVEVRETEDVEEFGAVIALFVDASCDTPWNRAALIRPPAGAAGPPNGRRAGGSGRTR